MHAKYKPLTLPGKFGIEADLHAGEIFRHTANFQPGVTGDVKAHVSTAQLVETGAGAAWKF